MANSAREEWEDRKQAMSAALMPYIKPSPSPYIMRTKYERVEKIVDACFRLAKVDGIWRPEFQAGAHIEKACSAAWDLHCHTNEPVRFSFNGTEITLEAKST